MNIFVLDRDPVKAAKMQCDKHVVKMTLESTQMLSNAYPETIAPYGRTHYNHPCSKWVRSSLANYLWLIKHALALCDEYEYRYVRVHECRKVILWCERMLDKMVPYTFKMPYDALTEFVLAMPDEFKCEDPVESYRAYYMGSRIRKFAKWTRRKRPSWYS